MYTSRSKQHFSMKFVSVVIIVLKE